MKKYRIDVPVFAYLSVVMKGEDDEDASYKIPDDIIFITAMGSIATKQGSLSVSMDQLDWGNAHVEEVK